MILLPEDELPQQWAEDRAEDEDDEAGDEEDEEDDGGDGGDEVSNLAAQPNNRGPICGRAPGPCMPLNGWQLIRRRAWRPDAPGAG
jgi:hypothetical protein